MQNNHHGFYLYHHNDLQRLAELTSTLLDHHGRQPLQAQTILVSNHGVGRWLQIQLAEDAGIAANLDLQLPGRWLWQLLQKTQGGQTGNDHFSAHNLTWHLYASLPAMADDIAAIRTYLGEPVDEIKRFQLAGQLATVLDKYMVYRADVLQRWEAGETPEDNPGRWQAQVWRWLTSNRLGTSHRGHILRDFVARLRCDTDLQAQVKACCPQQLYCFGLQALPPDHLRLLYALAEHVGIHFLLPNPSEHYWGDITTQRLGLELPPREQQPDLPGEAAVENGHPLLAMLGRLGRDTLRLLYCDEFSDLVEPALGEPMAYHVPERNSLLHRIQADIVALDCSQAESGMADDDSSLEIHACHSPLREVQVLQDQLLDRLSRDDSLNPRDIIVMVPAITDYAPAIQAVFGGAAPDRYLPFSLADRSRAASHPIMTWFRTLLDLPQSRWGAGELLDLLSVPAVMRRFGLSADDLDCINHWVGEAGIRWGRDGQHRSELGAGRFNQNSWRFGLDRLLLGVAQSDANTLSGGVAPWADLEGNSTAALGKLCNFATALRKAAEQLAEPATPAQWQTRCNDMIDALLAPEPDAADEQRAVDNLRHIVSGLDAIHESIVAVDKQDDSTICWQAMREYLRGLLDGAGQRQPFLSGGITFCGMVPLRAVPFRMVAILGMNDSDFPRQDADRASNIMHAAPRLGDRSTRDDDRLLFLQALTAARDGLYISYNGQNLHNGEKMQPSPIVGETLQFIARHYGVDEKRLVHEQPMQPFSRRYLDPQEPDSRIFTFATQWREATRCALSRRGDARPFVDASNAGLTEPVTVIDLDTIKGFFDHPPKAFFRDRLKLYLDIGEQDLAEDEPHTLDDLSSYNLREQLLATAQECGSDTLAQEPSELDLARGHLPPPPLARQAYAGEVECVRQLLPDWQQWQQQGTPKTLDIALDDVAGVRLTGQVQGIWPDAMRRLRVGQLKTQYRLRYWIDYLAAVAAGHDIALEMTGFEKNNSHLTLARYAGRAERKTAQKTLARLVQYYIDGQQTPLHFHPAMADEFAHKNDFKAFADRFKSTDFKPHYLLGKPYIGLLLGPDRAPLGPEPDNPWVTAITDICEPMNEAIKKTKKGGAQ